MARQSFETTFTEISEYLDSLQDSSIDVVFEEVSMKYVGDHIELTNFESIHVESFIIWLWYFFKSQNIENKLTLMNKKQLLADLSPSNSTYFELMVDRREMFAFSKGDASIKNKTHPFKNSTEHRWIFLYETLDNRTTIFSQIAGPKTKLPERFK